MATFRFTRLPVRKEVRDFLQAAEQLLSPALRNSELTPEECHLICDYLKTMCHTNHPWSAHFMSDMPGQSATSTVEPMTTRPTVGEYLEAEEEITP